MKKANKKIQFEKESC